MKEDIHGRNHRLAFANRNRLRSGNRRRGSAVIRRPLCGCQVKSCMRAKEELREYHRADKIRKEDPKVDKRMEEHKQKVEGFSTPDDLSAALTTCGTTGPTTKVEKPVRPRISQSYENLLLHAPPALQKEAQKHEWDWHVYVDKMEMRAWYR